MNTTLFLRGVCDLLKQIVPKLKLIAVMGQVTVETALTRDGAQSAGDCTYHGDYYLIPVEHYEKIMKELADKRLAEENENA